MPYTKCGDVILYHERAGSGPRLLFIGGTGGDLRQKPGVFEGPLAKHFDLLSFDQRGLGRSERPVGPYRMHHYADDAAALLEAVGWDNCCVMGVSFGGMVAQELAIRHPRRIQRLALACTSSGGKGGASFPLHEFQDLSPADRALKTIQVADTRYGADWVVANPDKAGKMRDFYLARAAIAAPDDPERDALIAAAGRDQVDVAEGQRLQLEARRDLDTHARLGEINIPVFICGGEFDGIAPPANQRALEAAIPNSHLNLYKGGHLFLVQDPRAFKAITEFLLTG